MKSVYFPLLFEATFGFYYGGQPQGGYYGGGGGDDYYGYDGVAGYGGEVGYGGEAGYGAALPMFSMASPNKRNMECYGKTDGEPCKLYQWSVLGQHPFGNCLQSICQEITLPETTAPQGAPCYEDEHCGYEQVCNKAKGTCELGEIPLEREDLPDFVRTDIFHTHAKDGDAAFLKKIDLDGLDSDEDEDQAILQLIHFSGSFRDYIKDHENIAKLIEKSKGIREIVENLIEKGDESEYAEILAQVDFPKNAGDESVNSGSGTFKKAVLEWKEKLDEEWDYPRKYLISGNCPEGLNTQLFGGVQGTCHKDSVWTGTKPDDYRTPSEKLDDHYKAIYKKAVEAVKVKFEEERAVVKGAIAAVLATDTAGWVADVATGEAAYTEGAGASIATLDFTGLLSPLHDAYLKYSDLPSTGAADDLFEIEKLVASEDADYTSGDLSKLVQEQSIYGGCDDTMKNPPYSLDEWRTKACDDSDKKFYRTFQDTKVLGEIRGLVRAVLSASENMKESVMEEPVLDDPTGVLNFESNTMVRDIANKYNRKVYKVSQTTIPPPAKAPQMGNRFPQPFNFGGQGGFPQFNFGGQGGFPQFNFGGQGGAQQMGNGFPFFGQGTGLAQSYPQSYPQSSSSFGKQSGYGYGGYGNGGQGVYGW